jgi:ribonuclease P protein component
MRVNTLVKDEEFRKIYKKGTSYVGAYLVLYAIKSENRQFGITVSKKIGKAVTRNRVRRLIKEFIRLNDSKFAKGYDYVIVARVRANTAHYSDIEKNFLYVLKLFKKDVTN